MSHKLIGLNEDLTRLRGKGFNIEIHATHLVVRDIPYVNDNREVFLDGILVSELTMSGEKTIRPGDHQIRFSGMCPCDANGQPINAIRPNAEDHRISEVITTQFHFSSKPPQGHYSDYYEKISTYAAILSGPAASLNEDASPYTRQVIEPEEDESPFNYLDTASARAEISMTTAKLAVEKIAIIGLGGTGSYVLDLISKTPVQEIHLFDGDQFVSHNAFRAPGAASVEQLHKQPYKTDYFSEIYSVMHRGIKSHSEYVAEGNIELLKGMSCVFLCIDASPDKRLIVEKLEEFGVIFIDTGMGLYNKKDTLGGILRVTTSTPSNRETARSSLSFVSADAPNQYDKNIQIADLNMLNAVLAVTKWKKLQGFYFDFKKANSNVFTVGTNQLLNEDIQDEN